MNETRGFDVDLGGAKRRAWLNYRACQRMGMAGPADADGFAAVARRAAEDFGAAAKMVRAALVDQTPSEQEVLEWIMDGWDHTDLAAFINRLWGREPDAVAPAPADAGPTMAQASDGTTPGLPPPQSPLV